MVTQRLSIAQAADQLGKHQNTIKAWIKSGKLQAEKEPRGKSHVWWVLLDTHETGSPTDGDKAVEHLSANGVEQSHVEFSTQIADLEGQLRIKDEQLASKVQLLAEKDATVEAYRLRAEKAEEDGGRWYDTWKDLHIQMLPPAPEDGGKRRTWRTGWLWKT